MGRKHGVRLVRSRILQSVSVAVAASLVSACGVYLHDAGLKTSTAAAKASFDALAAPAMFSAQRQNLRDLAAREDSAVAAYAVSVRNDAVLDLLRPSSRAGAGSDPSAALLNRVNADLARVYRPVTPDHPLKDDELAVLQNAEGLLIRNAQGRRQTLSFIQLDAREFARVRPRGDTRTTDCSQVADVPRDAQGRPQHPSVDASPADYAYHALQLHCVDWRNERDFTTANQPDHFDIADLFADATGDILTVLNAIRTNEGDRARAAAQAGALQADINKALRPAGGTPEGGADTASSQDGPDRTIATIASILHNGTPLARKAGLEALATELERLLALEMGSAAPSAEAAFPAHAAGEAASTAASMAAAAAPAAADTTGRATAVLSMIGIGARAIEAFDASPAVDRAGALLIGLAKVRHDLNMAKADLALEDRERELLQAQLTAVLRRGAQLAQALQILAAHPIQTSAGLSSLQAITNPRQRLVASEALTAYTRAWDTGEIPYDVLRFRVIQARRMAALDRAEMTEQDYRALLKPAIDTLAAYGAGGITPETIASVLGHLGIAASILGQ